MIRKLINRLFRNRYLLKHKFVPAIYIHHNKGGVVFETQFNWYDEDLLPVTIVREIKSNKTFSIRHHEMLEFVELSSKHTPNDGLSVE